MKKGSDIFFATLDSMARWASAKSMWPLSCGLSCCAIEMMHAAASRIDLDRFGCLFRSSPKQADLMIIAGTVTKKMLPQLLTLYEQMLSPKYVIAMGSCALSGGLYADAPEVISNMSAYLTIDSTVRGCPPPPEKLAEAILDLQSRIIERPPEPT